jgi:hypothetical protein
MTGTYTIESQSPWISDRWTKVPNLPEGMSRRQAEDHMHSMMDRSSGTKYRIVMNNPESEPACQCAYECGRIEKTNWIGTIFLLKRGEEDYWDRFGAEYPVVMSCVQQIVDDAGTTDADVAVIRAAAARMADYENWMMRAGHAMATRNGKAFDRLFREMCGMINVQNKVGLYNKIGGAS